MHPLQQTAGVIKRVTNDGEKLWKVELGVVKLGRSFRRSGTVSNSVAALLCFEMRDYFLADEIYGFSHVGAYW